jgi:hypothetical protein
MVLRLRQDSRIDPTRLIELLHRRPGSQFSPTGALSLDGIRGDDSITAARELLDYLAAPAA